MVCPSQQDRKHGLSISTGSQTWSVHLDRITNMVCPSRQDHKHSLCISSIPQTWSVHLNNTTNMVCPSQQAYHCQILFFLCKISPYIVILYIHNNKSLEDRIKSYPALCFLACVEKRSRVGCDQSRI